MSQITVGQRTYRVVQAADTLPDDYDAYIDHEQSVLWLSPNLIPLRRARVIADATAQMRRELAAS
jgi:hypothetical protein